MKKGVIILILIILVGVSGFFIAQPFKNREQFKNISDDNNSFFNPVNNNCMEKAAEFGFDKKPCTGNECAAFCTKYPECCPKEDEQNKTDNSTKTGRQASTEEQKSAPPVIKNLGVIFEDYNPSTKRAGDFSFILEPFDGKILGEFGQQVQSDTGGSKLLPHYTYWGVPKNTPVIAVTDGEVLFVRYQPETGDYEIYTRPVYDSYWSVGYDHVMNPAVKENDTIKAGDLIASAGNLLEISLETDKEKIGTARGTFYPLIPYLDPAIKQEYEQKIWKLLSDWETYKNNKNIYDESAMTACPACLAASLPDNYA